MGEETNNILSKYVPTYGPVIAWLITVALAIWNNRQQKKERIRIEHKEKCTDVVKTIREINRNLSTYHSLSERSQNLENQIKISFDELEFILDSFLNSKEFKGIYTNLCRQKKEEFYDTATGQYFESSLSVPVNEKQNHSQKITKKANDLIREVESIFQSKFD